MKQVILVALAALAVLGFSYQYFLVNNIAASAAVQLAAPELENYDIREDGSDKAVTRLSGWRGAPRSDRQPDLTNSKYRIGYNETLGLAETIDSKDLGIPLIKSSGASRSSILTNFLIANNDTFRINSLAQLEKTADYTNPDGNLSFVRYEQRISGIPVFGAEVTAGFSRRNEMFRVVNSVSPGVDVRSVSTDFGPPETAVIKAAAHLGISVSETDLMNEHTSKASAAEFRASAFSDKIVAEQFYFPVGNGIVLPAWRVLLANPQSAYYVVVDADGTLLWRKNLILHQTLPATYNAYGNSTSFIRTADSPGPLTPGCFSPTCGQGPVIGRTNFVLVGNEAPYTFNNLGWIPDTGLPVRTPANPNITDGNNVEVGIDRDGTNGVDENGWATGVPSRVFSYTYNPAPGSPAPGDEPLPAGPQPYPPTAYQQGSVTQGFYIINRWHDEMYRLGFNEVARNFQHFNFGRGGSEGDRVSLEIQDSSTTNGSTFSIAADGGRPRIQMTIWTGPTPDRDGVLDAQAVVHEMTHGLSTRLHGNATGLSSNMGAGMGEGWSDFFAVSMLSEPIDAPTGLHAISGYSIYQFTPGFEANYYYGIRRFPIGIRASTGVNGLPHNPLTFRYINSGCNTLIGTTSTNPNSAYPRGPIGSTICDQIHNIGEVWAVALWEVRNQLIGRHGEVDGNRRALQYAIDGMKLSPLNPNMIQARDAMLTAASFSDPGDVNAVRRGFAIRGMGFSAAVINPGTGNNNTVVVEAFDLAPGARRPWRADFDGDAKSDISVFRPSDRNWYLNRSSSGFTALTWGLSTDKPLADDLDGDGKSDVTVFRATADGTMPDFYALLSATSTVAFVSWGSTGDIPVSEDFDGDGKGDYVIYRPADGRFWVRRSSDAGLFVTPPFSGGSPIVGDFDGDGLADAGTFNNGTWHLRRSEQGYAVNHVFGLGSGGDKAVPADYDGDGKDDLAIYRPFTGEWHILGSAVGEYIVRFGISTDVPVPADYDGDSKSDPAVYRDGTWYIYRSTGGVTITGFGLAGDIPLPATFIP